MIPYCCSRSFLALLLGAGVSGGFSVSAPAGDKIEFSSLNSEDLARPTVDRAESESPDGVSIFTIVSIDNALPQPQQPYSPMPPAAGTRGRRNDDLSLNFRSGNDGLSAGPDRLGQNGGSDNPTWDTHATNYSSSKPASNYLDEVGAWEKSQSLNGMRPGTDKLEPRYGQPGARLESATLLERRALKNGYEAGDAASKSWTTRKEDAASASEKTSIAEMVKEKNKSSFDASYGLFRPLSQFYGSKASSAWGSASMLPSDPSLDASDAGRNKSLSSRLPSFSSGKNFGNQDPGNASGLPAMSGWGNDLGAGYQGAAPAAARKPPAPPAQAGPQRPQGGATLAWPKMPGANY